MCDLLLDCNAFAGLIGRAREGISFRKRLKQVMFRSDCSCTLKGRAVIVAVRST